MTENVCRKNKRIIDRPILVVDGLNVFMRFFVTSPAMSTLGQHCGGFLGFLGGLGNLCEKFNPKSVIIVWESGGSIKKRGIDPTYKNGRRPAKLNRYYGDDIPSTTENHNSQVSLLVKALEHLPVTQLYVRGCEADDVIGYLVRHKLSGTRSIVVSSDKDLYQLINDNNTQWSPGQKKLIDKDEVLKKFGISSENFCTAKVFTGDPGDNVQGVKGAGFKTLAKWFPELAGTEFVSYENVVDRANAICLENKGKTIKLIAESKKLAAKNWKLMYLSTSRLAGDQVQKINSQLENRGKSDKMSLMRLLVNSGMQKFDIDRNFLSISKVGR